MNQRCGLLDPKNLNSKCDQLINKIQIPVTQTLIYTIIYIIEFDINVVIIQTI